VIFTSDNGAHWTESDIREHGHLANNHLRGQKADIHEGGHRVPFVARWPGKVQPGSLSTQVICQTDLMATCAAIVGDALSDEAGEDSISVLPALLGEARDAALREATVHHAFDGMFAIRQGPWKLILGRGSGGFTAPKREESADGEPAGRLYHLMDDPAESLNLWDAQPRVVERLTALLEKYQREGRSR
jgi:arylsulfatase A-like enzyme